MSYVIYLSTEKDASKFGNSYGYWKGETYTLAGDVFPHCEDKITKTTKFYKSKTRAEKMAEKLFIRCGYILSYSVEEHDIES